VFGIFLLDSLLTEVKTSDPSALGLPASHDSPRKVEIEASSKSTLFKHWRWPVAYSGVEACVVQGQDLFWNYTELLNFYRCF
jgi:hypothetical protein